MSNYFRQHFTPGALVAHKTTPPDLLYVAGTNAQFYVYKFDASTAESAFGVLRLSAAGTGSSLIFYIIWYADSATTNNVVWKISSKLITPGTTTTAMDAIAFDDTATTTTACSSSSKAAVTTTVTIASPTSIDADRLHIFKVERDAASGSDTMTGDANLISVTVQWNDITGVG